MPISRFLKAILLTLQPSAENTNEEKNSRFDLTPLQHFDLRAVAGAPQVLNEPGG